jgi:hypothetical protein
MWRLGASERVGLSGAEPLQYCQAVPAVLRAVRGGQPHPEPGQGQPLPDDEFMS